MGWSCDLLCSPQRELDLGARRLLCLFDECANHHDPVSDRRNVKRTRNSIAARQPQFLQLGFQMLDVWLAEAFQAYRRDTFSQPHKTRLHVGRKGSDFRCNSFV